MSIFTDLKNHLSSQWTSFLPAPVGGVGVRKIEVGLTPELLAALKSSQFYSQKIPPSSMSASREKEWAEARRLELEMEEEFFKSHPGNILSSVSHASQTETPLVIGVGAVVSMEKPAIQGVGVDIEHESRKITAEVSARFLRKEESKVPIADVALWVLKEAAFKATPQDLQLVVSEYKLTKWDGKTCGEMISKNAKCQVKLVHHSGFYVGLAYFRF